MRVDFRLEGMTCLDCARTLERALRAVRGVESAEVSYPAKSASVVAADDTSTDELLRAVERAGYRAELADESRGNAGHDDRANVVPVRPSARRTVNTRATRPKGDRGADYDLLIVGTGGAGMAAAIQASELGAAAAIVEEAEVVGGTCVNVGCIPSKNLIEAAHHYHAARTGFPGIAACDPALAWNDIQRQKQEVVDGLRRERYLDVLDAYDGVTLLRGRAEFLDSHRVRVGEREVRARKAILATGTRPAMPTIPGLAEVNALDSTTVMELEKLPESMIVVGGGSIGLELGHAFSRFGVRVVVVETLGRILPNEDAEVSESLADALRSEGMEIHTGVRVTGVGRSERGYTVTVEEGTLTGEVEAEQLLVATGRRPNTDGLGLDAAGVRVDRRGFVEVDKYMRTSNPDVFAAGDVTGGPGYVYVAALQGGIAAQAALSEATREEPMVDLATVPRVTFTDPQVAAVGMTEAEARATGLTTQVTSLSVKYLPRAAVSHRQRGVIKLVSELGTDRLLGAHIVAPNAGDVIGEAALAVRFGLTTRDLVSTLHPYLTWGEGLKLAAQTFTKDVAKLSCCA
ncbi:MAG: mercury(II) reductase [Gemmatimonadaceae bacterium]